MLGELAEMARVPRQMVLRHEDRNHPGAWIPGLPLDFSGYVWIDKPNYLVEVQAVIDEDSNEETNRLLVSIDSGISVAVCEVYFERLFTVRRYALHGICNSNYVCLSVCHTRGLCPHGSTYDHDFFTIW